MNIGSLHVRDEWDRDGQVEVAFDVNGRDDAFDWLDREQVKRLHAHLGKLLYASESPVPVRCACGNPACTAGAEEQQI